jgi:hypothetical protein
MASTDHHDWARARDEYLEPLDRRFPKHPYKEKTEAWRDRIDLHDKQRRAEILEKPNLAAFSKPKEEGEALYVHTFEEASAALKLHHDQAAESLWREMAKQLTREGRENRGWILVATSKADELARAIKLRRDTVAGLLARAALPEVPANKEAYSLDIYRDIVKRFEAYPDVADLVAHARAGQAALEGEKPGPTQEAKASDPPEPNP